MPYAPWVFTILAETTHKGRRLDYDDAFRPYPGHLDWGAVHDFLDAANAAGVEKLAPWFVTPYRKKPDRALIGYTHGEGTESLWTGVHIGHHRPPAAAPTWGEVISWTLTSMTALSEGIATIRRSARGPVSKPAADYESRPEPEENNEMEPEEHLPEVEESEEEAEDFEPWVFEIIEQLKHDGRTLERADADRPFPGSPDWRDVDTFIGVAYTVGTEWLDSWFVYPDYKKPSMALIRHTHGDGSESLWTSVHFEDFQPASDSVDYSPTWGDVISSTLNGLRLLPADTAMRRRTTAEAGDEEAAEKPDVSLKEYKSERGDARPEGGGVREATNLGLSGESRKTELDEAHEAGRQKGWQEGYQQGAVTRAPWAVSEDEHVNRVLYYRRTAASLNTQIRLSRTSRLLVLGATLSGLLTIAGLAAANAATWGQSDMKPYNIAVGVILGLLIVVFVTGKRMNTGQPMDADGGRPKSLAELRLELDLMEERRVLEAAQGARSSKDRQHSYRESIPQEIDRLRRETRYYRRVHNFFQWGLFAASVAMSVTAAVYDPPQPGKGVLIALGAFVSFTTAVTGYFKFRERAFNLQQTSDAIEQHVTAYDLAIAPYNQGGAAANLERLAESVESLRVEQRKREQQLEQPHQGQQEVI
ncbi:SLATT domain-containing protein [Streptomyces decoyicus]